MARIDDELASLKIAVQKASAGLKFIRDVILEMPKTAGRVTQMWPRWIDNEITSKVDNAVKPIQVGLRIASRHPRHFRFQLDLFVSVEPSVFRRSNELCLDDRRTDLSTIDPGGPDDSARGISTIERDVRLR
jgi:hypothetical protein